MKRLTYAAFNLIVGILVAILYGICHSDQPPYQVSLFIQLHPKGFPIHLCNGAIVQSKLILTTAACVHYLLIPDKPIIPVHPSMLTVVAGSTNPLTDSLRIKVESIIIHQGFNATTMENDLAFLRLKTSLPLGTRDDIKWVILNEYSPNNGPCLANFHVRNSMDNVPDYTQSEELQVFDNKECLKYSPNWKARENDLCSSYILPMNFKCDNVESFTAFNGDRGTGLICKSSLVGLLSSILVLENNKNNNCSEKSVKAFYTDIGSYIEWAYDIIVQEEIAALQDNYTASAPFNQETEAIIQSQMTEPQTTESFSSSTSPVTAVTPNLENQHLQGSGSQKLRGITLNLTFLFLCVHFI